jgi:GR25 family glycosyltransferase involved in LPS biosynthesis
MWYRRQQQYRSKIAIDMSHFHMLERIAASNRSTLILEDDAQLTGERWLPDLLTALKELPEVRMGCSVLLS